MKRIRLFAAAALILLCGAGTGFKPQKDTIRVATWNVDSGSADLSDQKEFLSGIDADIIGLQEAEEKTARVNGVSVCDTLAEGLFYIVISSIHYIKG